MKRLFATSNIRVGYMDDIKTDKPIGIAIKDPCYKDGENGILLICLLRRSESYVTY